MKILLKYEKKLKLNSTNSKITKIPLQKYGFDQSFIILLHFSYIYLLYKDINQTKNPTFLS